MADAFWRWDDVDGVQLLRCSPLEAIPRVAHAFSSRTASGDTGFDLGPADGESPAVRERHYFVLQNLTVWPPPLLRRRICRFDLRDAHRDIGRPFRFRHAV